MSALAPFAPGIFRGSGEGARLIGSRRGAETRPHFPALERCGDDSEWEEVELPAKGTLYSYTVVRVKPPVGLPTPYAVGYVDLDGIGLCIFALLDPSAVDDYRIGMRVRLTSGPLGVDLDGVACERPYFRPVDDAS